MQFVQKTQLAANVMQADLYQRIVAAFELLVGLPMHTFGLTTVAIQDACLPAQPLFGSCPPDWRFRICYDPHIKYWGLSMKPSRSMVDRSLHSFAMHQFCLRDSAPLKYES